MRKQLLSVCLPLLFVVLVAAAETQSTGTETIKHATVQKINVVQGDDGVTVEITARGAVTPKLSTLQSPARVVLDLPNTALADSMGRINVAHDGVQDVRIGMDGKASPTSRIVIDLDHACQYELVPSGDNKVVLKLHSGVSVAKVAKPSPFATKTAAPVVSQQAAVPAPAVENKPVQTASAASNFVVVEPTYKPKDASETTPAVSGPPARVIEAASKFVEKPDTNLLPAPSAAMQAQAAPSAQPQAAPMAQPQTVQTAAAFTPAVNLAAEQKAQLQQAPAATGPKYTGEPISVNLKDVDLKDFFRLIHEISGLNVVLDPNVKGSLTIVLDDVPWDQALDIVLKNNDLDRQLEGNVLRIATLDTLRTESESRRKAQEAEALAVDKITITRFLSYAKSHDVVVTIKKFLSQRGDVISDDRTNAIIISDIPSVMPAVDRLLTQLDRKTQEVEIEARVVATTRSFARDIGTQLGFGFGNAGSAVGGASATGANPLSTGILTPSYITTAGGTGSSGSSIPLFSNLGSTAPTSGLSFITASGTVQLDAVLTMAESRGLLKILSRPRIVTQNNIQAVVKQGTRVPIVTTAQLGGPPTVTYVDAFLRLTVVPQITSEKTIFLNVDVENTTPDFGHQVNGNPSLITQQATTQILVTDGGTVVIGGVIQTNNSISISQVPLLGNIPFLGNLFKHTSVSTSNAELIFFITPRVIET